MASEGFNKDMPYEGGSFADDVMRSAKYGRKTREECKWNVGRMPNPEHGVHGNGFGENGLQKIFIENIFRDYEFPWTLTAAIMGAHTVGRVNIENSGYDGHWSSAEQQGIFNNDFFKSLLYKGWGPELAVNDNTEKNQWQRIDEKGMGDHKEMMLNTDMALVYTSNVKYEHCRR